MLRVLAPLLAAPLGALTALGQQPYSLWWCTLLGLSALFALHDFAKTRWAAAWLLWLFGTGYFALSLRWILEPFQVEADVFGWMAPFALALMAAGLALFWAAAGYVAKSLQGKSIGAAGALVLALAATELARAYILTGFPWAGLAQVWVGTKPGLLLATLGPHGLGLLTLIVAAAPLLRWKLPILSAAAVIATFGFHASMTATPIETSAPIIRLVQPNAPQHEKWDRAKAPLFFQRQLDATGAEGTPDLIIWPETAIPRLLNYADAELEIVAEAARKAPVIVGIQREEAGDYFNSLILLEGGQVTQIYDKHHLVPFGEYMPFPELFKSLGIRALAQRAEGGYTPGPGARLITLDGIGKAAPLICYEAVFPRHSRSTRQRARLILQVTNDAWFGTYAGPQQHLAQAQMRAIEQGLPLIRSANTGISAIINARGQITAHLPLGVHGHIDAPLPPALPQTFYARFGDLPAVFALLGALALLTFRRIFKYT